MDKVVVSAVQELDAVINSVHASQGDLQMEMERLNAGNNSLIHSSLFVLSFL